MAFALSGISSGQIVADVSSGGHAARFEIPSVSGGIRPDHLWTLDYVHLLWSDTGAVLTAPVHWDEHDWVYVAFATAGLDSGVAG